ncbi:hypothetical protein NL676_014256 [Syzygium grande]|nr:hypothetical protein NL676_014256 [Syzygium grande]
MWHRKNGNVHNSDDDLKKTIHDQQGPVLIQINDFSIEAPFSQSLAEFCGLELYKAVNDAAFKARKQQRNERNHRQQDDVSHENNNSALNFPSKPNFFSMEQEEHSSRVIGPNHLVEPPFSQSPAEFIGSAVYSLINGLGDDEGRVVKPIRSSGSEASGRASAFKKIKEFPHWNDGSSFSFFKKTPEDFFCLNQKSKSIDGAAGRKRG